MGCALAFYSVYADIKAVHPEHRAVFVVGVAVGAGVTGDN